MERLGALLKRLEEANLTINLAKSTFCSATVTYLGHIVGRGEVRPKTANVEAILQYQVPDSRKSLMQFMGMAGFYRRFCPNFASIAVPLTSLTSGKVKFNWALECQASFKILLSNDPVLKSSDFNQPFILQVDTSNYGTGAVLLQNSRTDNLLYPVCYFSCELKPHQIAYSAVEK